MAEAYLDGQSSIFVSINLDEAKEKVRYARLIIEALAPQVRPRLKRDNELGLEFANGARLTSRPARPPRGRARTNVYLDEFAHVRYARQIYTAALPIISKGGRLRVGSSPMGASDVFWEIFSESMRPYPGYTRKTTPWWEAQAFCTNVAFARKQAPAIATAARVEMFGNDRIKAIYANMPEDDFRQEYECEFVDETLSWISWAEIRAVQDPLLLCEMATVRGHAIEAAHNAIDRLEQALRDGKVERVFAAGVDVGRTRNATELYLVGLNALDRYPLRLAITMNAMDFDDQADVLSYALKTLPVSSMLIDQNGIGRNLAETMTKRAPGKVEGVDFTNASKTLWATDAKMLIQQRRTPLPADRDLAYQIHSIKRVVTAARNLVFDVAANEKHHADKFWAWALALAGATGGMIGITELPQDDRDEVSRWDVKGERGESRWRVG